MTTARGKVPNRAAFPLCRQPGSRRCSTLGTLILLMAIGATACSMGSSAVAWLPRSTTTTTLAPAPPCSASQLHANQGLGGAGLGTLRSIIVLTNVGNKCRLGGYPALVGVSSTLGDIALSPQQGVMGTSPIPADLGPGQQGELAIDTGDVCPAAQSAQLGQPSSDWKAGLYSGLIVELPGGQGSVTVADFGFDTACGFSESVLGAAPPPIRPGLPQSLVVSVKLPKTARSGQVLVYVTTLHNASHQTIQLRPCPSYTETAGVLATSALLIVHSFSLNCSAASAVHPGRSERFTMHIRMPKVTASAIVAVEWAFNPAPGYSGAVGRVRVIP